MEKKFDSIKIGLASPDMIHSWSRGEVTKPETINYRTLKAEKDGLFCEKIFGPAKDWECQCGKYKRLRYSGKVCEKCGVEVTTKKVRRERMGHIDLATPVSHIWYFRAIPSRMGLLLDISPKLLEKVLYYINYIVINPGSTGCQEMDLLTADQYNDLKRKHDNDPDFKAGMGAEAIRELLIKIDIEALSKELHDKLLDPQTTSQQKIRVIKRLEVVESFRKSGNKPEWMIMDTIPVIPPEIRPMVQLDGGRFATSDLNELYRRVINRNNRLKKLIEINAPEIIVNNEKRMLQDFVDNLIDNGRRGKPVTGASNRPLKSLSEMLRGKQGRFRQNLLGKRVDYSGRSVIVVGPDLKIYQCGLPKEMALELFKPFIMKRLIEMQKATGVRHAKRMVEEVDPAVWDALEFVIKEHPVLLNRAPTLHRLSIQAFEPILVEGRAIRLHPLVCQAFNADFDGDQMPVHVPLSAEAQAEARFLMLSSNNLLKPLSGKAVTTPSQDMVLGAYFLTTRRPQEYYEDGTIKYLGEPGEGSHYRNLDEAIMANANGQLGLHAPIYIWTEKNYSGRRYTGFVETTLGRMIFNQYIPQDLGLVDRTIEENILKPEVGFEIIENKAKKGMVKYALVAGDLKEIVDLTIKKHGFQKAAEVLDNIKALGYHYSTLSSISMSIYDMRIPVEKKSIIAASEKKVDELLELYKDGELTNEERSSLAKDIWEKTTKDVTDALLLGLDKYNAINMISTSGARGSTKQLRQLAGMRGLMFSADGKVIETPIKSNFREGMTMLEYFMGARSSRKSLSDTALRTADSGYLTRRLVDVSQDVIIREEDCGTKDGIVVSAIMDNNKELESLLDRIVGRYSTKSIIDPVNGYEICAENEMITEKTAIEIINAGITEVSVRSILRCRAKRGVCAHCYGMDMATSKKVSVGEAVGVVAAQSIGEPGTQLTMRTFHTGGVAGSDITQGLPRVEELFEARRPKKAAIVCDYSGTVHITTDKKISRVHLRPDDPEIPEKTYDIPYGSTLVVNDGQKVEICQALTLGNINPNDILRLKGIEAVYDYIIREVQSVYRAQEAEVNDKHIEVIARQMTRKLQVVDKGDTDLLPGTTVDMIDFREANEEIDKRIAAGEEGLQHATSAPVLLGITKASLQTESWMSAASFQETTKVLTEAAIKGKVDHLLGLKENVIIGKLIPAGTGLDVYNSLEVRKKVSDNVDTYFSTEDM